MRRGRASHGSVASPPGGSSSGGPGSRLFLTHAALSAAPVLALGLLLGNQYRGEVEARGLAEARAQAQAVGHAVMETHLEQTDLRRGIPAGVRTQLADIAETGARHGQLVRMRLRDADQRVVFANDAAPASLPFSDEVADALAGRVVAHVTHLEADEMSRGHGTEPAPPAATTGAPRASGAEHLESRLRAANERVVEVYLPMVAGTEHRTIGVLELYLPYEPIARNLTADLHHLYLYLAAGLALLYLALAGISWSTTRRLRLQAAAYEHLALHDTLTGLPNRALFHDRVATALAHGRRQGTGTALVLLDLDRFKEVNDTLGHHNGDALLVRVAQRLTETVREVDSVARLGGDEFALVLPGVSEMAQAEPLLARVRAAIEEEVELVGLPLSVEASMGVAFGPQDGDDVDVLLQHADVAMYVSKGSHAGPVCYDVEQDHYNADRLSLVAELRRALERDELVLYYQPKAELPVLDVRTVEALVRWQHPTRGLLAPDVFLPVAEQTGLIEPLTRWVLTTALRQLREWQAIAPDLVVAVNISARSLQRLDFPDVVLDALTQTGCTPDQLLLEITETALVSDAVRAAEVLDRLHRAGFTLSLDDFGQGYTSLGYLRHLPLSELKIDKSFVMNMLESGSDAAIVRSVVELGHNLGLAVVAEGVETEATLAAVTALGCNVAQGYLFAKPFAADHLGEWLTEHELSRGIVPQRSTS